jgi:hypothetical protein
VRHCDSALHFKLKQALCLPPPSHSPFIQQLVKKEPAKPFLMTELGQILGVNTLAVTYKCH